MSVALNLLGLLQGLPIAEARKLLREADALLDHIHKVDCGTEFMLCLRQLSDQRPDLDLVEAAQRSRLEEDELRRELIAFGLQAEESDSDIRSTERSEGYLTPLQTMHDRAFSVAASMPADLLQAIQDLMNREGDTAAALNAGIAALRRAYEQLPIASSEEK